MSSKKTISYVVNFAEVDTGIVVGADGEWITDGSASPHRFDTVDEARSYADERLEAIPYGEAWIGTDEDPQMEMLLSPHYLQYEREKRAYEFWFSLPAWRRWFTARPVSTVYKVPSL